MDPLRRAEPWSARTQPDGPAAHDPSALQEHALRGESNRLHSTEEPLAMAKLLRRPHDGVPVGDPIPFRAAGEYHLFYLTSPRGTTHYPQRVRASWYHARSTDLVQWEELPVAVAPGNAESPDADGAGTGSVIEAGGRYYLFYTGHRMASRTPQTICLATSTDLIHFEKKDGNPLLTPDEANYEPVDWRDPYVFFNETEQCFWMLIAARRREGPTSRRGCIVLATSEDLLNWQVEPEPLYVPSTYCPECPELFSMDGRWFLVYSRFSERAGTIYRVGDSPRGPWRVPSRESLDGRRWYAAKSLRSVSGNRAYFGWLHDRVDADDAGAWLWGGDLGVPREVCADDAGELLVRLPDAVRATFDRPLPWRIAGEASGKDVERLELRVGSAGGLDYRFINSGAQQYLFACELTPSPGAAAFGLLFRVDDDLAGYALVFDSHRGTVALERWPHPLDSYPAYLLGRSDEQREVDGPRLVVQPLELREGRGIRCQVIATSSTFEAFIDDTVGLSYRMYGQAAHELGVYVEDGELTCKEITLRAPTDSNPP